MIKTTQANFIYQNEAIRVRISLLSKSKFMNLFKIVILMTNLRFSRVSTKLIKILKIQMIKNSKLLLENQKLSGY